MKLSLIAAFLSAALCWCSPAFAQLDYMPQVDDMSTVAIGPTSPLGIDSSSSVGGTGIPFGATEIPSAGLSPLATYSTGTIALPGSGTTCPTTGTSTSGLGSADTYDGGGMAMGSATTATAATAGIGTMTSTMATSGSTEMAGIPSPSVTSTDPGMLPTSGMSTTYAMDTVGVSGMCSFASNGPPTSPSAPMSTAPTTPGGNPRTGVPLGSSEIANLGVGSWATIPTPGLSPFVSTVGPGVAPPAIPATPVATAPTPTTTTNTVTAPGQINVSGIPINVSGITPLVPGIAGR